MSEYIYEETPSGSDVFGRPVDAPMLTRREKIVRCKDCKHCMAYTFATYCVHLAHAVELDGFCAWACSCEKAVER